MCRHYLHCHLTPQPGSAVAAPVVAEAIATLECRVAHVVDMGASALLVAQVVAASADPAHWEHGWRWDHGLRLLHHLSASEFTISSEVTHAHKPE